MPESFRFDRFSLEPDNRRLTRDGAVVELNARYLDALALLVREQGQLVSKERFLEEVWQGVPVTDEALTQCIRTLRKQLGDDAGNPRFIETVPKHGYRFIAPVNDGVAAEPARPPFAWRNLLLIAGAGTLGGGVAGFFGGLFYGAFAVAQPDGAGGGASLLLVLICMTMLIGVLGAAGVALGIAAAGARGAVWTILGGALGGFIIGSVVKLIGLDTFSLLFGQAPGSITGGPEGALLGAAVGAGAWLAQRAPSFRRSVGYAAAIGAVAGVLIHVLGGRLMAGSLDQLTAQFPQSRVRLDQLGRLFGEDGFGPITQIATGGLEGLLFAACVVGAMLIARRRFE